MAAKTSTTKVTFGKGKKGRKGVNAKNKSSWNKKAIEDDQKFISEQEKTEPTETQLNQ